MKEFFSALGFLKSKVRNKLDKNLENCMGLYTFRYEVNKISYERALELWRKKCQRRGLGNIFNIEITNSSSGTSIGSIDVEDED
jgi:hypothetical protein